MNAPISNFVVHSARSATDRLPPMRLSSQLQILAVALLLAAPLSAQAVHWSPGAGGNGHWYEFVSHPGGISWDAALLEISAPGQHLATMSDAAENSFCFSLASNPAYWTVNIFSCGIGPWIGGYQSSFGSEPAGGWAWVDGSAWSYVNWYPGEPSNSGGTEHVAHFFNCSGSTPADKWNDITQTIATDVLGYVAEYEFTMDAIVPGAAGGPNGLFTSWGTPGNTVYFLASLRLGTSNVPGCSGLTLGIASPSLLGSGLTSVSGGASKTILIPGNMAGRTAHFQAADRSGCRVTQVLTELL